MKKRIAETMVFSLLIIIILTTLSSAFSLDKTEIKYDKYSDFVNYYKFNIQNERQELLKIEFEPSKNIVKFIELSNSGLIIPRTINSDSFYINLDVRYKSQLGQIKDSYVIVKATGKDTVYEEKINFIFEDTIEFPKSSLSKLKSITAFNTLMGSPDASDNGKLLRSMIIILILVIGTVGTYYNYQYLKNKYAIPPLRKVNLSLLTYMVAQLMKNKSPDEITSRLMQNNWNKIIVKQHFDVALGYKYDLTLLKYVANAKKKAISTREIRENLTGNNWNETIVENHLKLLDENPKLTG